MNKGLRADGVVEDVDGDGPPKDGRVVGDDDGDDFPLREGGGVPPAELLHRRAKVLLPKFHLETAVLHPESHLLIFLGQKTLCTRRWTSDVGQGAHYPPGRTPSGSSFLQYFLFIPK